MKRTKERTRTKKDYSVVAAFSVLGTLIVSILLFVTNWPKYKVEGNEVVSHTHNYLLNMDIPVNYFWVSVLFAVVSITLTVYLFCKVDGLHLTGWTESFFWVIFILSLVFGFICGLGASLGSAISAGTDKGDAVLTAYTKDYKASPSMYIESGSDKTDALNKLVVEVKSGNEEEGDFIDNTFSEKNSDSDPDDYVYRVIEKNDKYYLVGTKKGSDNLKDAFEVGEISKAQSRELAALTDKVNN